MTLVSVLENTQAHTRTHVHIPTERRSSINEDATSRLSQPLQAARKTIVREEDTQDKLQCSLISKCWDSLAPKKGTVGVQIGQNVYVSCPKCTDAPVTEEAALVSPSLSVSAASPSSITTDGACALVVTQRIVIVTQRIVIRQVDCEDPPRNSQETAGRVRQLPEPPPERDTRVRAPRAQAQTRTTTTQRSTRYNHNITITTPVSAKQASQGRRDDDDTTHPASTHAESRTYREGAAEPVSARPLLEPFVLLDATLLLDDGKMSNDGEKEVMNRCLEHSGDRCRLPTPPRGPAAAPPSVCDPESTETEVEPARGLPFRRKPKPRRLVPAASTADMFSGYPYDNTDVV